MIKQTLESFKFLNKWHINIKQYKQIQVQKLCSFKIKKVIKGTGKAEMSSAITRNKMKDGVGDWIVLISGVNTENEDFGRETAMSVKKY